MKAVKNSFYSNRENQSLSFNKRLHTFIPGLGLSLCSSYQNQSSSFFAIASVEWLGGEYSLWILYPCPNWAFSYEKNSSSSPLIPLEWEYRKGEYPDETILES